MAGSQSSSPRNDPFVAGLGVASPKSKTIASAKVVPIQSPGRPPKLTKANAAMHPFVISEEIFCSSKLQKSAFYADENILIFNMEIRDALRFLLHIKCWSIA